MAENMAYLLSRLNGIDPPQQSVFRLGFDATTIVAADYAELDVGFKPSYVCVENFTDLTKFEWYEGLTTTVSAGSFVVGVTYKILSAGTTNFTLIGAPDNNIGTEFVAIGVGSGTGTATTNDNVCIKTASTGGRSLVVGNSISVRDRVIQLSQNATTAMILASKNLCVIAVA